MKSDCLKSSIFGRIILLWNFPIFLQFACSKWFRINECGSLSSGAIKHWTTHYIVCQCRHWKNNICIIKFAFLNQNMSIFVYVFLSLLWWWKCHFATYTKPYYIGKSKMMAWHLKRNSRSRKCLRITIFYPNMSFVSCASIFSMYFIQSIDIRFEFPEMLLEWHKFDYIRFLYAIFGSRYLPFFDPLALPSLSFSLLFFRWKIENLFIFSFSIVSGYSGLIVDLMSLCAAFFLDEFNVFFFSITFCV